MSCSVVVRYPVLCNMAMYHVNVKSKFTFLGWSINDVIIGALVVVSDYISKMVAK